MVVKAVQLGVGQQGRKNLEKLAYLRDEEKYPIKVAAIIDSDEKKLEKWKELFPEAEIIVGSSSEELKRFSDANLVFDSTNTPNHIENARAWLGVGKKGSVYAGEKPFVLESRAIMYNSDIDPVPPTETVGIIDALVYNGITPMMDAVESYMPTKQLSLEFMVEKGLKPEEFYYFRGGNVIDKSIKTGRNILRDFGGAFDDKTPHDISRLLQVFSAAYGNKSNWGRSQIFNSLSCGGELYTLGLLADGEIVFVTKDGKLTKDFSREHNDSYADVNLELGNGTDYMHGKIVATHLGVPEIHRERMESMLTKEVKEAVAEYATSIGTNLSPADINAAYGTSLGEEARMEEVKFDDGSKLLTQTYGNFFAVYISPDGEPNVLQYGWGDGHLGYVRNAVEVAMGKAEPLIGAEIIKSEAEISSSIGGVYYDYSKYASGSDISSLRGNYMQLLDLRDYPEIKEMFEPDLSRLV
jgi:hypothetical protein